MRLGEDDGMGSGEINTEVFVGRKRNVVDIKVNSGGKNRRHCVLI